MMTRKVKIGIQLIAFVLAIAGSVFAQNTGAMTNLNQTYTGNNNFGGTQTFNNVIINGTCTGCVAAGEGVSPSSLTFPNTAVGASSASQTVTVTNTGLSSFTFSSFAFSGTGSLDFTQTNNCPTSLAQQQSCLVSVTFSPLASGSLPATLTISTSAPNSPQTVSLSGTGSTNPVSLTSITLAPPTSSCGLPCQQQETATCNYNNSTSTTPCTGLSWFSSNTSLGTVSTSGLVTGVSAGTPMITAVSGTYNSSGTCSTSIPSGSRISVNCLGPQQSGDTIILDVGGQSAFTITSVVDGAGNTYADSGMGRVNGNGMWQQIYVASGITASSNNDITVTFSGTVTSPHLDVEECTGCGAIDAHGPGGTGASGTTATDSITTTTSDMVVAFTSVITGTANAAGTGYTYRYSDAVGNGVEDGVFNVAGATAVTMGLSTSSAWLITDVAFKSVTGTAAPTFTGIPPTNYYTYPLAGGASDAHGCTNNTTDACLTIKRCIAVVEAAGIGAGGSICHSQPTTYTEHAPTSPPGTIWTVGVNMDDGVIGGVSASRRFRLLCDGFKTCLLRPSVPVTEGIVLGDNSYMDVMGFDVGDTVGSTTVYQAAIGGIMARCDSQGTAPNCQGTSTELRILWNRVHDLGSTANTGTGTGCSLTGAVEAGYHAYSMVHAVIYGNEVFNIGAGINVNPFCNYSHGIYAATPGADVWSNLVHDITSECIQAYDSSANENISNNTLDNCGSTGLLAGGSAVVNNGNNNFMNILLSRPQQNTHGYGGAALNSYGGGGNPGCTSMTPNYWTSITALLVPNALEANFSASGGCDNQSSVLNTALTLANVYTNVGSGVSASSANYAPTSSWVQSTTSGGSQTCGAGTRSPCTPTIDANGCAITSSNIIRGALQPASCVPATWPWY
jgi:hypothetical protein